jgi:hypothetical protein
VNYTELYNAIIAETENNDPTFLENIPVMVNNAEKRIYQAVKIPALRKNATTTLAPAVPYTTLPTDYLAPWEFAVIAGGSYTYLLLKDVSFLREMFPNPSATGTPRYYAQFDADTFILAPTPSSPSTAELHYFYYPESIVTAGTSWVSTNFENVLLYAALVEAAVFMKSEEDTMKAYAEQFAVNLKLLKEYSDGKLRSGNYRN